MVRRQLAGNLLSTSCMDVGHYHYTALFGAAARRGLTDAGAGGPGNKHHLSRETLHRCIASEFLTACSASIPTGPISPAMPVLPQTRPCSVRLSADQLWASRSRSARDPGAGRQFGRRTIAVGFGPTRASIVDGTRQCLYARPD